MLKLWIAQYLIIWKHDSNFFVRRLAVSVCVCVFLWLERVEKWKSGAPNEMKFAIAAICAYTCEPIRWLVLVDWTWVQNVARSHIILSIQTELDSISVNYMRQEIIAEQVKYTEIERERETERKWWKQNRVELSGLLDPTGLQQWCVCQYNDGMESKGKQSIKFNFLFNLLLYQSWSNHRYQPTAGAPHTASYVICANISAVVLSRESTFVRNRRLHRDLQ